MQTLPLFPWVLLTTTAVAGLLLAEYRSSRRFIYLLKPLGSTGFIGAAVAAGALESSYGLAILTALILSWWGDFFLMFRRTTLFLAGLVSFLLAHGAYGVAFLVHGIDPNWALVAVAVLLAPAFVVARWLDPHLAAAMRKPVWAYVAAITVMFALAIGTRGAGGHAVIVAGALAFYVSDISVARDRFVSQGFSNRLWGLPLYYSAQILLAASIRLAANSNLC